MKKEERTRGLTAFCVLSGACELANRAEGLGGEQGFSATALLTFGPDDFFVVGHSPVLSGIPRLYPVDPRALTSVVTIKNVSRHGQMSLEGQNCP